MVGARDPVLRAEVQRVASCEAGADAHHRRNYIGVIYVRHRDTGEQHRGGPVFRVSRRPRTGERRRIIHRRDVDGAAQRVAGLGANVCRICVSDLPGNRAAAARCGGVVRGRVELDRAQRRGEVGQRCRTRQRQHMGIRVVATADAVLRRHTECIAAGVAGTDRDGGARHLRIIRVRRHRHRGVDHCRRTVFRVRQGLTAAAHHRRFVAGADGDGAGLDDTCRARPGGIALGIEVLAVVQRNRVAAYRGWWGIGRVLELDGLQNGLDLIQRGCTGELDDIVAGAAAGDRCHAGRPGEAAIQAEDVARDAAVQANRDAAGAEDGAGERAGSREVDVGDSGIG